MMNLYFWKAGDDEAKGMGWILMTPEEREQHKETIALLTAAFVDVPLARWHGIPDVGAVYKIEERWYIHTNGCAELFERLGIKF